jgi:protein-L-isoaspartate(D-aspartate) O-methyltransferase
MTKGLFSITYYEYKYQQYIISEPIMNIKEILKQRQNERIKLINSLRDKGISNESVLQVMLSIPREIFLSEDFGNYAYDDHALAIDCNQTISQPYTVAFMTELLEPAPDLKVLEIGTGSGYQSIILDMLGMKVYTVERIKELHDKALQMFDIFELKINARHTDGSIGWSEFAPFNRIIVTASTPKIPKSLIKQLAPNGIIVCPVGNIKSQVMYKGVKSEKDKLVITKHEHFRFVPLIGEEGWSDNAV